MKISTELAIKLAGMESVCVLTGAGISAESGVPTFRGRGETSAVWKGLPFEKVSSSEMVRKDIKSVWEWFDYRRGVLLSCRPNPAHMALAEWENRFSEFTVITQNVDTLHRLAGSKNVIELHGNIHRSRCLGCGKIFQMEVTEIPHKPEWCDQCRANLRPDVILFGEMLQDGVYESAIEKARKCEVFFVIGTSALVYPAAAIPNIARQSGAYLVEVNLERTPITDYCDSAIFGRAGEIIPKLAHYF